VAAVAVYADRGPDVPVFNNFGVNALLEFLDHIGACLLMAGEAGCYDVASESWRGLILFFQYMVDIIAVTGLADISQRYLPPPFFKVLDQFLAVTRPSQALDLILVASRAFDRRRLGRTGGHVVADVTFIATDTAVSGYGRQRNGRGDGFDLRRGMAFKALLSGCTPRNRKEAGQ